MRRQTERRDEGFTLIEILITTMVIGLISAALTALVGTFLRVMPTSQNQVDSTRVLQRVSLFMAEDIASAAVDQIKVGEQDSSCSGYTSGDNLLWLMSQEVFNRVTSTTYIAYRTETTADSMSLVRVACTPSTSATPAVQTIVSGLKVPGGATVVVNGGYVEITLTDINNKTVKFGATTSNPAAPFDDWSDVEP